jgi:toxin ParE1/3/4
MTYRIDKAANKEILDITQTIQEDNPFAAEKWHAELIKKLNSIAQFPRMGRMRDDLIPDMYMFPFGNYLIFYDIEPNGIVVTHVADGRQDIHQAYARKSRTL